ncbi:chorismate mutase [Candidatus Bathyarchaeota archaeon]|nr:chorismate mutase [Candidatus Bathyarchaeota archaeon]
MERLTYLRKQIDEVDRQILDLLRRRLTIAEEIGRVKVENRLPTRDEEREREVLERAASKAEADGIDPEPVRRIFTEIIRLSTEAQKRT